jgi:hypothetical protein
MREKMRLQYIASREQPVLPFTAYLLSLVNKVTSSDDDYHVAATLESSKEGIPSPLQNVDTSHYPQSESEDARYRKLEDSAPAQVITRHREFYLSDQMTVFRVRRSLSHKLAYPLFTVLAPYVAPFTTTLRA